LNKELEELSRTANLMREAAKIAVTKQNKEYHQLERIQKMVTGHYNTMNNGAKWSVGGSEVKMIHGFINYCKAQVDQAHRGDVVVKILALCKNA